MLSALLIFLVSAGISFAGSVQLGPVNLLVIDTSLFMSRRQAVWVAAGGSLPEFIYCSIALYLNAYLERFEGLLYILKIIFTCVLFVYAIIYLCKKKSEQVTKIYESRKESIENVFKGFTMGLFNPQLLPFWMAIQFYFNSTRHLKIETSIDNIAFVLGSGIGAFLLLWMLILAINKHKLTVLKFAKSQYYYKAISILLFAIATRLLFTL